MIDKLGKTLDLFPEVRDILTGEKDIESARDSLLALSWRLERSMEVDPSDVSPLRRVSAKEALTVFRNYLSRRNERVTGHSFLSALYHALREGEKAEDSLSENFMEELEHLFKAMLSLAEINPSGKRFRIPQEPEHVHLRGRRAAAARSGVLDELARYSESFLSGRYPSGLDEAIVKKRKQNVKRILAAFGGSARDWNEYRWHLAHIIRDSATLRSIIELSDEESHAIDLARERNIPFGITPYYASLMDREAHRRFDHAVRAQVIPPLSYVEKFHLLDRKKMDFMHEQDTSPVRRVTRRYPMIAIFKPYNACAQICVYCQRNWEIDEAYSSGAMASKQEIDEAINWFKDNTLVKTVLITGGDPLVLADDVLDDLLGRFMALPHIERIRIGTRTPAVLPFRLTQSLAAILRKYHVPGTREICIVTHFEHPYEITPEALNTVQRIKKKTHMSFYNQQVFTIENSRRFETVALRRALKTIGIDPYYVFHAKGKRETEYYRVPVARLIQERHEEAMLIPGTIKTDEPVYNIPGIGKNHLDSAQDHELIMLTPRGSRIYEMHPWEKALAGGDTHIYEDTPIYGYLQRLEERGENVDEYETIYDYY